MPPPHRSLLLYSPLIILLFTILLIALPQPTTSLDFSLLVSSSIRGNAFPTKKSSTQHCYSNPFDDQQCEGGCARRAALAAKIRESDPNVIVVDTGNIYFGTVLYTLYGTEPFEQCISEIGYDILSLGGSDLYVGLDVARLFFMNVVDQNQSDEYFQTQSRSNFDIFSQSLALPNQMVAHSLFHNHEMSLKMDSDEKSQHLHDRLQRQFSGKDPATLQERLVHQIQTLTYPSPQEQTIKNVGSNQPQSQTQSTQKSSENSETTQNSQKFKQTSFSQDLEYLASANDDEIDPCDPNSPGYVPPKPNPVPRKAHAMATNLNVTTNSAWRLIMSTSVLFDIPGNDKKKIAFLSLLPDWYRSSITNCPPWFRIGLDYSSTNHIRAEITRLKRLYGDTIASFVLVAQEDTTPDIYRELYQIEFVNVFVAPIGKEYSVKVETSIYGEKIVVAQYKGGHNVLHLKINIDDTTKLPSVPHDKNYFLDGALVTSEKLEIPQIYCTLKAYFDPSSDDAVTTAISKSLSEIYGLQYEGNPAVNPTDGFTADTYGCRSTTCPMGLLASAALLSTSDRATISLLNAGAIRGTWDPGDIGLSDVLRVFPFFNKIVTFNATGSTLLQALAHSMASGVSPRFLQTNLRWVIFPYMGETDGASLEDALSRIMDVSYQHSNGQFEPINPKSNYRIVTVSYLTEGNDGFDRVFTNDTMIDVVHHSDTLLTSIVNHLRKSKFVWTISRQSLAECLFSTPLPFSSTSCLMAITNTTSAQYRPCPSQQDWCILQKNYSTAYAAKFLIQQQFENQQDNLDEFAKLQYQGFIDELTMQFQSNNPSITTSPIDWYKKTYFPELYQREFEKEQERQENHEFYFEIPENDQQQLLSSQQLPSTMFPRVYSTANTGWADELIATGQLWFTNQDGIELDETETFSFNSLFSSPFSTLSKNSVINSTIELVPGIFHDPELPVMGDCTSCSGYGQCLAEGACECTVGDEAQIDTLMLYQGKPTYGLYQGIEMISGSACSVVLTRFVRSSFSLFVINAIALSTFVASILGFAFVVWFRKHPIVKSSGSDMLIVMTIGGAIVALGISLLIYSPFSDLQRNYLNNVVENNKSVQIGFSTKLRLLFPPVTMCNLTLGLTLVGFITIFGALLAKAYRIHSIFNARTLHEIKQFSNKKARFFLGIMIGLQIVLIIVVWFVSPMDAVATKSDSEFWVDCNIPDLRYQKPLGLEGDARWKLTPRLISYIFLVCYNVIILCVGVYLSLVTRNVDKSYNESTVLALSVYNIILCAIVFFLALMTNNPTFSKLLQVSILAYGALSTILLMLGPKLKVIWKQRKKTSADGSSSTENNKSFSYDPITLRIQALEREQKIESQEQMERTITSQQLHIASLIQHILNTKDDFDSMNIKDSNNSYNNDDDDNNNDENNNNTGESHPLAPKSTSKHSRSSENRKQYTISNDIQSIISQYQQEDLVVVKNKGSLTQSPSSASIGAQSNISTTDSQMSEQDQRRNRLKSTFGHMSKTSSLARSRPAPTSNPLLSPISVSSTEFNSPQNEYYSQTSIPRNNSSGHNNNNNENNNNSNRLAFSSPGADLEDLTPQSITPSTQDSVLL